MAGIALSRTGVDAGVESSHHTHQTQCATSLLRLLSPLLSPLFTLTLLHPFPPTPALPLLLLLFYLSQFSVLVTLTQPINLEHIQVDVIITVSLLCSVQCSSTIMLKNVYAIADQANALTVIISSGIATSYASYAWGVTVTGATYAPGGSWPVGAANWGTAAGQGVNVVGGVAYPNWQGGYNIAFPVSFTYSGTGTVNINVTYSNGAMTVTSAAFPLNLCPSECNNLKLFADLNCL